MGKVYCALSKINDDLNVSPGNVLKNKKAKKCEESKENNWKKVVISFVVACFCFGLLYVCLNLSGNPSENTAVTITPSVNAEENIIVSDESIVVAEPPPVPVEAQVSVLLQTWISAWQNTAGQEGQTGQYGSFYSEHFSANGLDKIAWLADKNLKNRKKSWIKVSFEEMAVRSIADDQIAVLFTQAYDSSNYSEISKKELKLAREGKEWKIISETSL